MTYTYPRVTYSDPKMTYSDPRVTHSDPTHLPLSPPTSPGPQLDISLVKLKAWVVGGGGWLEALDKGLSFKVFQGPFNDHPLPILA